MPYQLHAYLLQRPAGQNASASPQHLRIYLITHNFRLRLCCQTDADTFLKRTDTVPGTVCQKNTSLCNSRSSTACTARGGRALCHEPPKPTEKNNLPQTEAARKHEKYSGKKFCVNPCQPGLRQLHLSHHSCPLPSQQDSHSCSVSPVSPFRAGPAASSPTNAPIEAKLNLNADWVLSHTGEECRAGVVEAPNPWAHTAVQAANSSTASLRCCPSAPTPGAPAVEYICMQPMGLFHSPALTSPLLFAGVHLTKQRTHCSCPLQKMEVEPSL